MYALENTYACLVSTYKLIFYVYLEWIEVAGHGFASVCYTCFEGGSIHPEITASWTFGFGTAWDGETKGIDKLTAMNGGVEFCIVL